MERTQIPRRCARRVREEENIRLLRQDPYVLAYRYHEFMEKHPMRRRLGDRQYVNGYYENLLANQPEPEPDATDDRSRAIRYAQEHFECYYEIHDIARIIAWLDEAEDRPIAIDMATLLDRIAGPSPGPHETSSP